MVRVVGVQDVYYDAGVSAIVVDVIQQSVGVLIKTGTEGNKKICW